MYGLLDRTTSFIVTFVSHVTGQEFWCLLDIVPIKNEKSEVVLFLASHKDITSTRNQFIGMNSLQVPGDDGGGGISSTDDDEDDDFPTNGNGTAINSLDPEAPNNYNYGRRRSRAVLYQLSGHYKPDKPHKKIHTKISTNVR